VKTLDSRHHDPVIAGRVLGDDLALERREGIGDYRRAAVTAPPAQPRETVGVGVGSARDEAFVVGTEHVHREPPRAAHARPCV
jgi:hypothetical protein